MVLVSRLEILRTGPPCGLPLIFVHSITGFKKQELFIAILMLYLFRILAYFKIRPDLIVPNYQQCWSQTIVTHYHISV